MPLRGRGGRHVRPSRRAVPIAAVALLVLGAAASAALRLGGDGTESRAAATEVVALRADAAPSSAQLFPGGILTGSVLITNEQARPLEVSDAVLTPPTADTCGSTGVSLAPTLPPTPESPLVVPAGGTATLEWTAYMDGNGEDACQGATLTSVVILDGQRAGTVTLTAGVLDEPPAPVGGVTTSTRAAVRWSPSAAADPGWVLERAVAGTTDWQPACGSSPQRPVRALGCTDTGLTRSTAYVYRVTLRSGHWRSTSRPSAPVTTQARPSA